MSENEFRHQVLSDEELAELRNTLKIGIYKASVIKAEAGATKKPPHNPMLILTLRVWDYEGKEHTVKHWIVNTPKWQHIFKHFWESAGHLEIYQQEAVPLGKYTEQDVWVKTNLSDSSDGTYKFPGIADYIREEKVPPEIKAKYGWPKAPKDEFEDDIPF